MSGTHARILGGFATRCLLKKNTEMDWLCNCACSGRFSCPNLRPEQLLHMGRSGNALASFSPVGDAVKSGCKIYSVYYTTLCRIYTPLHRINTPVQNIHPVQNIQLFAKYTPLCKIHTPVQNIHPVQSIHPDTPVQNTHSCAKYIPLC